MNFFIFLCQMLCKNPWLLILMLFFYFHYYTISVFLILGAIRISEINTQRQKILVKNKKIKTPVKMAFSIMRNIFNRYTISSTSPSLSRLFSTSNTQGIYTFLHWIYLQITVNWLLRQTASSRNYVSFVPVSYTHLRAPRDKRQTRMPSSAWKKNK